MPRRAVVTGSASGIGQAVATLLRERGEEVIGIDLRDAEVRADLSTPEGRAEAIDAVRELSGGTIDSVITCAGVARPGELMVRVNYFGTTEVVEGLRPLLAGSPTPRVAVVGSISATQTPDPEVLAACLAGDEAAATAAAAVAVQGPGANTIYPATKAALAQWARRTAIATGWADAGIPINVVSPGVVLTPMTTALFEDDAMRKVMDKAVPMPLHGYAKPEDVARVLVWLAEPSTTHITGQVIYVDGGAETTLRGPDRF